MATILGALRSPSGLNITPARLTAASCALLWCAHVLNPLITHWPLNQYYRIFGSLHFKPGLMEPLKIASLTALSFHLVQE